MNLGNVMYYMWGYREVPVPYYSGKQGGVSDICCMNFDNTTNKLTISYEKDGKKETISTVINIEPKPSTDCVTDIVSMKLNKNNELQLIYLKDGKKAIASVNLDSLEDDIFIEELGDDLI